ncbi:DUF3455 domain-containing protein [Polaromonas sp.]|uniref:DUF3455 domain-containing protein n=1 Tax=Polaromonas sp. TaxID=1869339 RepID=UPI003BAA555B
MKSTHNTVRAYGKGALTTLAMVLGTTVLMAACNVTPVVRPYDQTKFSEKVRVPAGNVVALETTATGNLTYECRANTPAAGSIGWVLVSPSANLYDRDGKQVGTYSGPPATWTMMDGSSVTGTQVAIEPVVGGIHIPLQLSAGTPGPAPGMLQNITYIQRVNTKNGQDFINACTQAEVGQRVVRPYQADYIFWRAS